MAHSNNTILLSFCLYETFAPSNHPTQPFIDKTDFSSPDSAVSGSVRQVTYSIIYERPWSAPGLFLPLPCVTSAHIGAMSARLGQDIRMASLSLPTCEESEQVLGQSVG